MKSQRDLSCNHQASSWFMAQDSFPVVHRWTRLTLVSDFLLLCFIVADANAAVQRAGGYDGLSDTDGQTSDGLGVEGLGQKVKICRFLLRAKRSNSALKKYISKVAVLKCNFLDKAVAIM